MPKQSPEAQQVADPTDQLTAAWTDHTRQRYEYDAAISQQANDIAVAIAEGAPASLEQFVYASLGAHPDWKTLYEQIATVNEQVQSNVPLALFSKGVMRYFGYPEKFGSWSRYGDTSRDHNAFTYTFENSKQRDGQLAKLIPALGERGITGATTHYFSTLSLPMRTLYDFEPRSWNLDGKKQENVVLENMFRSSSSALYRAPFPDAEYNFHMTTLGDEEPGEKLVVASGMRDIVTTANRNLDDVNLRRLKFAIKHEDDDTEAFAD